MNIIRSKKVLSLILSVVLVVCMSLVVHADMGYAPISGTTSDGSYYGSLTVDFKKSTVSFSAEPYDVGAEMYLKVIGSVFDDYDDVYYSLNCEGGNSCYRARTEGTDFTHAVVDFYVESVFKGQRVAYSQ